MTLLNRLWDGHFPITWSLAIIVGTIAGLDRRLARVSQKPQEGA